MKLLKFLGTFSVIFGTMMMFQNCGGPMGQTELSSEDLANLSISDQSLALRKQYCLECHNSATGVAEPRDILDDNALINDGWIVPGEPDQSPLYKSLFANMPKNRAQLNDNELQIFASWINALGGSGLSASNIVISDSPQYDFGSVTTGDSAVKSFTLKNTGEQDAKGIAGSVNIPFRFKGGSYPGEGGDCPSLLKGGEQCTITVEFVPASADDYSKDLVISYNDLDESRTSSIKLLGKGSGVSRALLTISNAPKYVFTSPLVGKNVSQAFTITNSGAANATAVQISLASGDYSITGQTCASTLATTKKCTVTVRFAPTNTNKQTTTLKVSYKDGSDTVQTLLSLVATGLPANTLYYSDVKAILASSCLSCHTTEFGSYSNLMAFKKSGTTPAINPGAVNSRFITRISSGPNQMGAGSNGSLSASDREKIISWIVAGAPNNPVATPALLTIDASPKLDFDSVTIGASLEKTLTVKNTGGTSAESISSTALPSGFTYSGGTFPGTGGTCQNILAKNASCTLKVTFKPTSAASYTGDLKISYFDGTKNASTLRPLQGQGKGTPIAVVGFVDPTAVDMGLAKIKEAKTAKVQIKNSGSATAKSITVKGLASGFSLNGTFPGTGGTCSTTLGVGSSCFIVVAFKGTKEGKASSTMTLTYNDGSTTKTLTLGFKIEVLSDEPVTYQSIKSHLGTCFACHSSFRTYSGLMSVVKAKDMNSLLLQHILGKNGKTQMGVGSYGSLSEAERQLIVEWVEQGALEYEKGSITQAFRPHLGDRYYITSVLHRVFGEDPSRVVAWTKAITGRMDLFGKPCFLQDQMYADPATTTLSHSFWSNDSCNRTGIEEGRVGADISPAASAVAEATRQTTCFRLANDIENTKMALSRAKLAETAAFNAANIQKMYSRFLPGTSASADELESLGAIGSTAISEKRVVASSGGNKTLEGWRYVILTMCLSPKWTAP